MMGKIWIGAIFVAVASVAVAQTGGEATYKAQCQMCHGETGKGDTPVGKGLHAKSFSDPQVIEASKAKLIGQVKNGSSAMPPFKDKLTDAQIKDVIAYVRTLERK